MIEKLTRRFGPMEMCVDLQRHSLDELQKSVGTTAGNNVYNLCRGIDTSSVMTTNERKSVSCDINYGIRFTEVCNS
jgi:DNA repair protein REV1